MDSMLASLDRIDAILGDAKTMPFSSKLLIDEEELSSIVEDLRLSIPEEVKQARIIAQERRDILNAAESQGEEIVAKARQRADMMIEEHQITKEAKNAADGILQQARDEAAAVRSEAKANARDIMDRAQRWADEIQKNARLYVERIIREADETFSKSVNEIKKLRQSVKQVLDTNAASSRPNIDE